jgi:pyrrolidone-carboxylate peptidase
MRLGALLLGGFSIFAFAACAADSSGEAVTDGENEVKVDTRSPEARAQYDADVAFLQGYRPRCTKGDGQRPRVLLTGFGRFMSITNNATGRMVSEIVPAAKYPETEPPPAGQIDPPEPQLSVATATVKLPSSGEVDICAMILPVYWDLAAILISKEIDAFVPNLVMMNGVAGARQSIWLEMGAINRAQKDDDGSNQLQPFDAKKSYAKVVDSDPDGGRPNLMTWNVVAAAAEKSIEEHAEDRDGDVRFGDLLFGAMLGGFPRASNTYLCNNVTYVTGWLMSHPHRTTSLLRANPAVKGKTNEIKAKLEGDFTKVPRVFVHWPSELADRHHAAGAAVMRSIIDAQISALAKGQAPTLGDNAMADPDLKGGDTF